MWHPAFWRGSDDCIHWSEWEPVIGLDDPAPKLLVSSFRYYQGRILVDGKWRTSDIKEGYQHG